ncbi:MAG: M20/M25/M40 family metallo-hydrolase [Phycisphaerae bacterium]
MRSSAVCGWLVAGSTFLAGCAERAALREIGVGDAEWSSYRAAAERIAVHCRETDGAYRKLEQLCDDIGHRVSGSEALAAATRWAAATLRADGHEAVALEPVSVVHWVRGRESCELVEPRAMPMAMLGLGGSVATPPGGISAEVKVVHDEAELERLGSGAAGRIVLFDNPMPPFDAAHGARYGETVRFRGKGASLAAKKGAVACLIRSVTAHSLRTPHTGAMRYEEGVAKIPAAALSTEDAAMISRLTTRGQRVAVRLEMEAHTEPAPAMSANVVGELRGRERPEEVVVIGGHIDSWDVGQGAHDDGAGCAMAMEALTVLRQLKLTPRRTIRVVLWTNEENGLAGGRAYFGRHAAEAKQHVAAIECDSGAFRPLGFGYECASASQTARVGGRLAGAAELLRSIGATEMHAGGSGADLSPWEKSGCVLLGLSVEGSHYFDYHHTPADTFDKIDRHDLQQCVAALATMAYFLAETPRRIGE